MTTSRLSDPRPRQPGDDECCGRGCDPCIFDYYDRALQRWEAQMHDAGLDPTTEAEVPSGLTTRERREP